VADNYNCLHAAEADFNFEPDIEHTTNDPVSEILPNIPTMLNLEDLKAYIDSEIQKGIEKFLPAAVEKVLSDPENPILIRAFENVLAISDLKILKRLYTHDKILGLVDLDLEDDEEHEPTIPEQITELKEKIENLTISTPILPLELKTLIPETKTEARAVFLVQYLENEVKERSGELFLNGSEIKDFITRIIPEKDPELAPKKDQNIRKIKKDVLAKVKKIFGNKIEIDTNKHGRHETRIFLRSYPTVPS
jgi:hypothetical protein